MNLSVKRLVAQASRLRVRRASRSTKVQAARTPPELAAVDGCATPCWFKSPCPVRRSWLYMNRGAMHEKSESRLFVNLERFCTGWVLSLACSFFFGAQAVVAGRDWQNGSNHRSAAL